MFQALRDRINSLPRRWKSSILASFDAFALVAILWLSFQLRLGTTFQPSLFQWVLILLAPLVALPIFLRLGLYRSVIRYLPDRAVWTILQAMALATLTWVFVLFVAEATRFAVMPRSIPLFYFLLGTIVDCRVALRREIHPLGPRPPESGQDDDADLRRRRGRDPACDRAQNARGGVRCGLSRRRSRAPRPRRPRGPRLPAVRRRAPGPRCRRVGDPALHPVGDGGAAQRDRQRAQPLAGEDPRAARHRRNRLGKISRRPAARDRHRRSPRPLFGPAGARAASARWSRAAS